MIIMSDNVVLLALSLSQGHMAIAFVLILGQGFYDKLLHHILTENDIFGEVSNLGCVLST